jgi:hypothetical protein
MLYVVGTFLEVFNGLNIGQLLFKLRFRTNKLLLASNPGQIYKFLILQFGILHVLIGSPKRTLSLIGNDIWRIVLARAWIALIVGGNTSNSPDTVKINKLPILQHGGGTEWDVAFVPTLLVLVSFHVVGTWARFEFGCAHEVLIHEPFLGLTFLIILHI